MKLTLSLATIGLFALPALSGRQDAKAAADVGQKIPQFSAQAVAQVDSHDSKFVTAYMIVGTKCGATPSYAKRFKALEDEYRGKGVEFLYVFPNKTESREEKLGWMKQVGLHSAMVDDEGAKITQALGFQQTASVLLVDKDGKIVYRGGIDDNRDEKAVKHAYLAEAIKETLAGKPVSVTSSKAFG